MDNLENDNVYPFQSVGYFPVSPKEQKKTIEEEIAQTLNQLPVLKQVIKHLDEKIAATDSIKKALELSVKYDISEKEALIALDIVNQQLSAERSYISARVERAIKR